MNTEEDKTWDFEHLADRYDKLVAGDQPLYARYDEVLDAVVAKAKVSAGMRVLDIGAGTGNLAMCCIRHGATVIGLDPSEAMLAKAQAKLAEHPNVELLQAGYPFLQLPFPDASFDAVVSTYAFHHVPPGAKAKAMGEMFRVLKSGGSWALGDLIFENAAAERAALRQYKWLEEEYFARIEDLRPVCAELGTELNARQFTPVTWVVWAAKAAT